MMGRVRRSCAANQPTSQPSQIVTDSLAGAARMDLVRHRRDRLLPQRNTETEPARSSRWGANRA